MRSPFFEVAGFGEIRSFRSVPDPEQQDIITFRIKLILIIGTVFITY
jgi:hypothetical protein